MAEESSWTDFFQDTVSTVLEVGLPAILDGEDSGSNQQQVNEQYSEQAKPVDNVQPISGGNFAFSGQQLAIGGGLLLTAVVLVVVLKNGK